jgi:hypothetical protein
MVGGWAMNREDFEEFIRRNPEEAMRLIAKAFKEKELLRIGNRSYLNAFKHPESYFDIKELMPYGGSMQVLNSDMLQTLRDPLRLFTDQVVIPPSYLIFKDDAGNVYARNGRTGQIDFSGADASTVIQNAINALTAGKILVRAGTYICKSSLTIGPAKYIVLEGEGEVSTILKLGDNVAVDYLIKTHSDTSTRPSLVAYPVEIRNLKLDGNKGGGATGGGIFYSSYYGCVENVEIFNFSGPGLYITNAVNNTIVDSTFRRIRVLSCDYGVRIYYGSDFRMEQLELGSCTNAGLLLSGSNVFLSDIHSYGNGVGIQMGEAKFLKAQNIQLAGNGVGLYATGYYSDAQFNNIIFWDNSTYHIQAEGTSTVWVGPIQFNNIRFVYEATRPSYAVRFNYPYGLWNFTNVSNRGTPYTTAMWYVVAVGAGANFMINFSPPYGTVPAPVGRLIRNSGTATIAANNTSVTVPHGLVATPSKVIVTPRGNIGSVWVSARDATNITISCSTAPTADTLVDWYAEV